MPSLEELFLAPKKSCRAKKADGRASASRPPRRSSASCGWTATRCVAGPTRACASLQVSARCLTLAEVPLLESDAAALGPKRPGSAPQDGRGPTGGRAAAGPARAQVLGMLGSWFGRTRSSGARAGRKSRPCPAHKPEHSSFGGTRPHARTSTCELYARDAPRVRTKEMCRRQETFLLSGPVWLLAPLEGVAVGEGRDVVRCGRV